MSKYSNHILIDKGKQLSWLLRHDSHSFVKGLIDNCGWRSVDEIINKYHYTQELLDEIVKTNNKNRYEYNEDKTKIRARQGHSINVDVGLTPVTDVDELYHGTSDKFIDSIIKEGIKPMSRIYVQLSKDIETAITVGKRHGGKTVIIIVDVKRMISDGESIYISNNGIYCTKYVDPKYFNLIMEKDD